MTQHGFNKTNYNFHPDSSFLMENISVYDKNDIPSSLTPLTLLTSSSRKHNPS